MVPVEYIEQLVWTGVYAGAGIGMTIGWVIGLFTAILCLETGWRWWCR
jgi:hypothetical protein